MRKFILGSDRGHAALIALILVMVLSSFFITLAPQINAANQLARKYKAEVIRTIEKTNIEAIDLHELY